MLDEIHWSVFQTDSCIFRVSTTSVHQYYSIVNHQPDVSSDSFPQREADGSGMLCVLPGQGRHLEAHRVLVEAFQLKRYSCSHSRLLNPYFALLDPQQVPAKNEFLLV